MTQFSVAFSYALVALYVGFTFHIFFWSFQAQLLCILNQTKELYIPTQPKSAVTRVSISRNIYSIGGIKAKIIVISNAKLKKIVNQI